MCLGLNPTESVDGILTLPETNITLENKPSQKEIHLPTIDFQGQAVSFREGKDSWPPGPWANALTPARLQRHLLLWPEALMGDADGVFPRGNFSEWTTGNPYKEWSFACFTPGMLL